MGLFVFNYGISFVLPFNVLILFSFIFGIWAPLQNSHLMWHWSKLYAGFSWSFPGFENGFMRLFKVQSYKFCWLLMPFLTSSLVII